MLPRCLSLILETGVSIKRLEKFLLEEDIDISYIKYNSNLDSEYSELAISIKDGWFYWINEPDKLIAAERNKSEYKEMNPAKFDKLMKAFEKEAYSEAVEIKPILKGVNLRIKKGSFIAILGE